MNKYSQYDILDGLTSIRVGLLSILGEMPVLKKYILNIPHLNLGLLMGILQYAHDKDIIKKLIFVRHDKRSLTIVYYEHTINLRIEENSVIFTLED